MTDQPVLLMDTPRDFVRRLTLNRPQKRNALSPALRRALFEALEAADRDPGIRVVIIRGAGSSFSAGYDLGPEGRDDPPYHTAGGHGYWPRHVTEGWFRIWDLAKPVIAQVHGYCLAGGSELATACDLVYVAENAQIGYPPVRAMSPPDMQFHPWLIGLRHAMEHMLTGDAISGKEAAAYGFANRALPEDELEHYVLDRAARIAKVPPDLQQVNKRCVHRAMEIMGIRTAIRAGTEIQAVGWLTASSQDFMRSFEAGVTSALNKRDEAFGDYRTEKPSGRG